MSVLASKGQLRASFIRWALFTVPTCVLLGFLSGQFGSPNSAWFQSLVKPSIFPDPIWFGIVWTILYVMMGLALALICAAWGAKGRTLAIILFVVQFALNIAWTPVFFGAYQMTGGLIVLGLLAIALIATIVAFWRIRALAGALLIPYLAWVGFASVLNYEFLRLNPEADGQAPTQSVQRIEF
ncbi:TspO/MBR family protein [Erythrobacter sp. HKB08]|uniref:TspO/MBR family protein n=1 Tax=Erythrobacter sp. HKB08 TaxID=2502843 RepID=UPI0010091A3A|nr:TspO/MBR family protein [Erythrobacter sp. HKB08]